MSKFIKSVNFSTFAGNLTEDPKYRITDTGISISRFTLAVSNSYTNKEGETVNKPLYLPVVSFGDIAENISTNFFKGDPISISGRLQNEVSENGNSFISLILTKIN